MDKFEALLKQYWGFDSFRGIQRDIIESVAQGHDTLGLMPTGGGKSVTFQVPALATEGLCLVITPLIALMKDQVAHLRARGILATAIYSGMPHSEVLAALDNCVLGPYKFLYVSPERLQSDLFQAKLRHMRVSFITIDEAHCISQWGYDFRPSYLQIKTVRKIVPEAPVLALTATATPLVIDDIQRQLDFREPRVFRMSFERRNLVYVVRRTEDKSAMILRCLKGVAGTAIIYTRSRRQTREIAEWLNQQDITATFYHAGLTTPERDERQSAWQSGKIRVMVATNAFGMGIDKPDVRLVVHLAPPDSIEAYYQEAGRAGRDGLRAYAALLYGPADRNTLMQRVAQNYPDEDKIRAVYESLCYYYQLAVGDGYGMTREFNLSDFSRRFHFFPLIVQSSLLLLQGAGYLDYRDDEETRSRLRFIVHRNALYDVLAEDTQRTSEVVDAILRTYPGVFADDVYINESLIAHLVGCEPSLVYSRLVMLNACSVVVYRPYKRTAFITFTRGREETERISLESALYEERRKRFTARLGSVVEYAEQDDRCRSRYLLRYFADHKGIDCGLCDVCAADRLHHPTLATRRSIAENIFRQLDESGPLLPAEIQVNDFETTPFLVTLQELVDTEYVCLDDKGRCFRAREGQPYGKSEKSKEKNEK